MGKEIERKFLVKGNDWKSLGTGVIYCQGYLPTLGKQTVRVRIIGERGYLTIKGSKKGQTRAEFEYEIPLSDAQEMLDTLCIRPLVEKTRYKIQYRNSIWEVDEFLGENEGLIVAEVELESENQTVDLPDWIDREVNHPRYYNSSLVRYPYSQWKEEEK
jgi:CYTH domain-containing protein